MSGNMLTWLADEFRAAGLTVVEYDGWTTRARSSGGFASGKPFGVWWHHTASVTSPQNDANYMCHVSDNRPIANVLVARDGSVWVLAAGCTNTNGKGRSMQMSRGTVPTDSANTHVLGMEIANNGIGESYPQAQVDAAFKVSAVVNAKMGNQPGDVCTHQHYAPDRKVDPAMGGNAVQGSWHPRECTNAGTWDVDDLRAECQRRGVPTPSPKPPQEAVEMFSGIWKRDNGDALFAVYTNGTKQWLMDQSMLKGQQSLAAINGIDSTTNVCDDPGLFAAMGILIGPVPPGCDQWGNIP